MQELKESYYRSLGEIIFRFQDLEKHVTWLLSALLTSDSEAAEIVCSQLSFRKQIDALDALFRYKITDAELIDELNRAVILCGFCEQKRNTMVHSFWEVMLDQSSGIKMARMKSTLKRGRGFRSFHQPEEIDDISEIFEKIKEAKSAVFHLLLKADEKGFIDFFDKDKNDGT